VIGKLLYGMMLALSTGAWAGRLDAQAPPAAAPADLIVTAGRIRTVDPARPLVQAMAVRGGRIVFVGSAAEAAMLRGPATRMLDLGGRTVVPGLIDAHAHLVGLGSSLRTVDLTGTHSIDEVVARVAARARQVRPGEWIRGRGWNQNEFADTRFPTNEALSRAVPDNPVILSRVDGHALLANAKAIELAHVTAQTQDPAGGRILRGAGNVPSGVFVDAAQRLIGRVVPPPSPDELRAQVLAAVAEANKYGLTGLHDPGESQATIDLYEELARAGQFNLRDYVMIDGDSTTIAHYFQRGPQQALYDGHIWIRAIKMYADGALGSRGAALLEDYSDEPGNRGLVQSPPEQIERVAEEALRRGFQVNTHAIGDRANRTTLDAYEQALRAVPHADHRFRIEHAQVIHRQDIPRFAQLGVIPSMQTSHQTSDAAMTMNRIGWTRVQGAYAWRSLLNTGTIIANGTDTPVEPVNPLIGFHSAVTRQDVNGWPAGGWFPEERMTRDEALMSMTIWPAWAAFMEDVAGSLAVGKYADFTVLDQDIMSVAPERILDTHVVMTVVGGQVVYERREP
jgi:predicted amidohydrolase YtcJ